MKKMVGMIAIMLLAALIYLTAFASDQQEIKGKIVNGVPVLVLEDGQKLVGELEIKHGVRELLGLSPREMFNTSDCTLPPGGRGLKFAPEFTLLLADGAKLSAPRASRILPEPSPGL